MKRFMLFMVGLLMWGTTMAQVSTASLKSEAPESGKTYYIVSDNGYFITTSGVNVVADEIAPQLPEWTFTEVGEGKWIIRNGANYLAWKYQEGNPCVSEEQQEWELSDEAFRKNRYTLKSDVKVDWYGEIMEDNYYIVVMPTSKSINVAGWPSSWSTVDYNEAGYTQDLLFFSTLPDEIDNREEIDDGTDPIIDVPVNDIEGDFLANWEKGMQDAKVMTYAPMDNTLVHHDKWAPARKGVTKREMVLYNEDVVSLFYGNKAKNLYFMLPANATKIRFFISDPYDYKKNENILWEHTEDYSATVAYLMSQSNGTVSGEYGQDLNLSLLRETDHYYTPGEIVAIPCDYVFNPEHPNVLVGYELTYPGNYSENYKNGKNERGGLYDGIWGCTSYLLPVGRTYNSLLKTDDDPDFYGSKGEYYEDYTGHQQILKEEYRWSDNVGLFCYIETEGEGGFPHSSLKFDDVKVARCYTGDAKLPVSASFTNFGVDPIMSATFDVSVGDHHSTLRFKKGIKFLEVGNLDGNLSAPTVPTREPMRLLCTKINGREVTSTIGIDGTVVAVNQADNVRRAPVVEENTGTWCGWCPRGLVGMEKVREQYGESAVLIGIHTGNDQNTNGMMDEALQYFDITGAPIAMVNRRTVCDPYYGVLQGTPAGILNLCSSTSRLVTEASVAFTNVEYNEESKTINFETSTTFQINSDECPYTLTYALTEDGLSYTQTSYYITQTSAAEREYYRENDPDIYALTQCTSPWRPVINDIMKWSANPLGIEGSLTGPIRKGEAMKHTYSFCTEYRDNVGRNSDHVADIKNCRLIALLIDKVSHEIVNATQVRMNQFVDGIDDVNVDTNSSAKPIYDLQGRMVQGNARGLLFQAGRKFINR